MKPQTDDGRLVLTVEETGAALDLSPGTVRKGIRQGWIPAVRLGRKWLIPRTRLEEMLAGASESVGREEVKEEME